MEVTNANWGNILIDQRKQLKLDDKVVFTIGKESFIYMVCGNYLQGIGCPNDLIFDILGLSKYDFCDTIYGYRSDHTSIWPSFERYDYNAATKVVIQLFKQIEGKNGFIQSDVPELTKSSDSISITVETIQPIKILL